MVYDHALKAGNTADVWKHFCLLAVTARLLARGRHFRYVDTHAGAGRFRLCHGGEWLQGIGRLASKSSMLAPSYYVREAAAEAHVGGTYPGSWRWVLTLARSKDHSIDLRLFDTDRRVIEEIPQMIPGATVEIERSDGYAGALRNLSADLIFVDPSYAPDAGRDWERVIELSARLSESGVGFLVWYPLFLNAESAAPTRIRQYPRFEIAWDSTGGRNRNLRGCGLITGESTAQALLTVSSQLAILASVLGGRFVIQPGNS